MRREEIEEKRWRGLCNEKRIDVENNLDGYEYDWGYLKMISDSSEER